MYQGVDSCRNRVDWILSAGQPVDLAYRIVNEGCSGQCSCDVSGRGASAPAPAPKPEAAPASSKGCDQPCRFNGGDHSCRDRISWLVNHRSMDRALAEAQVHQECSGQCSCPRSDSSVQQ